MSVMVPNTGNKPWIETRRLPRTSDVGEMNSLNWSLSLAEWALNGDEHMIMLPIPSFLHCSLARLAGRLGSKPVRRCGLSTMMPSINQVPNAPMDRYMTIGQPLLVDGQLTASPGFYVDNMDGEPAMRTLFLVIREGSASQESIDRFVDAAIVRILEELAVEVDNQVMARDARIKPRTLMPGLHLPDGMKEDIASDLEAFLGSYAICAELRIPWRRGYLLYGPPGCGKTRCLRQLGLHFGLPLTDIVHRIRQDGSLNLGTDMPSFDDFDPTPNSDSSDDKAIGVSGDPDPILSTQAAMDRLTESHYLVRNLFPDLITPALMRRLLALRQPSAFYLEDLDKFVAFQGGERHKDAPKVPLHELLKALDGVKGAAGTVIFMTTNHPEMVAESLVRRPGRVDRIWRFGLPEPAQMVALLDGLGYSCKGKPSAEVARELCAKKASMAFAEELVRALRMQHRRRDFSRAEVDAELKIISEHLSLTDPSHPGWGSEQQPVGFNTIVKD